MLRKTIVALFTIASVGMLAPDVASARGGFGGGGFHGGMGGAGFRGGGVGMGGAGFRAASIGPGFRSAAVNPGFRSAAAFSPGIRTGVHPGFCHHHRGFPFAAAAFGAGLAFGAYPYGYYDDYYDYPYVAAGYYDDYGCYLVRKRVWTPYGWTFRRVQVCS